MRIEVNFSIEDLCKEYTPSELMKIVFENFDYISKLLQSNTKISNSDEYSIYVSYRQSEDGETGTFIYIIDDDQNSIFALEKLFAKNEEYRKEFAKLFTTKLQFKPETEIIMFCSNGGWYEYTLDKLL